MNAKKNWSRRQVLKGAGVALSLPWLETFAPRMAHAQAALKKRYVNFYFPNGTADYWKPSGGGATWTLSPILQPFEANKAKMQVLAGVGNHSPFGGHVEPSHGHNCAAAFTGVKAPQGNNANSSISVDQVIADHLASTNAGKPLTPLHSLQLGLSTLKSSFDGLPEPHSRSISWKDASTPLYNLVSPQAAFDRMVGPGGGTTTPTPAPNMPADPIAERRRMLKKSSLDYIIESSTSLATRLSKSDKLRIDKFLTATRNLETRILAMPMPGTGGGSGINCGNKVRPTETFSVASVPAGYNRGMHANLMIDLTVMAIQCDITRVVSFMLDDARSDYVYNFITKRKFTATGSAPSTGAVGGYHGAQHGGNTNDDFSTIGWWNSERVNEFATKLDAVKEGGTASLLDQTVIHMLSGMHGGNHDGLDLPMAIIGGGAIGLKQNQFVQAGGKNLADLHLTIIQKVFGSPMTKFGTPMGAFTHGAIMNEILA